MLERVKYYNHVTLRDKRTMVHKKELEAFRRALKYLKTKINGFSMSRSYKCLAIFVKFYRGRR